jgi:glucose-1-phosphate adenylyltransferase
MDMLCEVRPKPVLPYAGRFKVIDFSLSNCIHSQINNIAVLTDYQRSALAQYVLRWHMANAPSANLRILDPKVDSYQGTADAVYQNLDYVSAQKPDTVLILAGDHVYRIDYARMIAYHKAKQADVTVGVIPVPVAEAHRFGTVTIDAGGRITGFIEKSPLPGSHLASMGIYVFNPDFLVARLSADAKNPDSKHDFGYSLFPNVVKTDRVYAYPFDGYWQDIGSVVSYYEANMELTREQPALNLGGTMPVMTDSLDYPQAKVLGQATVINSLISPGCVIKGRVENSILSPGVWVEEQAVVRNSVVMENTFIGFHTIVERSVLDEGLDIGSYCYIGFGSGTTVSGQNDITVVGKGAVIPPHTTIGRNCKILPRVQPADFSATVVPYGATVSQNSTFDNAVST